MDSNTTHISRAPGCWPRRIGALAVLAAALFRPSLCAEPATQAAPRPNILWLTCEDIGPHLRCYGERYAVTPVLDRLAAESVRFTHAFAPIGVCAPARSCLITGMYPPSIGTHPMRCEGILPAGARLLPEHLRAAGYYTTNKEKTDYNLARGGAAWDESSGRAHWRRRKLPEQPFFSVFNFTSTHESQIRVDEKVHADHIRALAPHEVHDPAGAPLPPYHPDRPEVRRDWARYFDRITLMDKEVGKVLAELEADGLADETIVFFFSDHGAGMPRAKRWLYDSSLRVPLLIRFPPRYAHLAAGTPGSVSHRLVSFVDFAPAVLSLAGVALDPRFQGLTFLGPGAAPERQLVHGFRDRMDERFDMVRAVRDRRFKYIRNFFPHRPWFHEQHIAYMYELPAMRVWQELADAGKLSGPSAVFMARTKPVEELYDTEADPHEVENLAAAPLHGATLERLRAECRRWMLEIRDLGLLSEADLRERFGATPPFDAVRARPESLPIERLLDAAYLAGERRPEAMPRLAELLEERDSALRWWGVVGIHALGRTPGAAELLRARLVDPSPSVRVEAAEALGALGELELTLPVLGTTLRHPSEWIRLAAVNGIDRLDAAALPLAQDLLEAALDRSEYVRRVAAHAQRGI